MSRYEKSFLQNDIKYLPVILERNEKAVGNIVMKKYGKEWRIRAEVAAIKCVFLYPLPDSSLTPNTLLCRSTHSHTSTAQEWRQGWIALPWYSDAKWIHKEKNRERKLSPDTGKVSAELTKGVSMSRKTKRSFFTKRYYLPARHSWTEWKSGREYRYEKVREKVKNPGRGCSYQMCFPVPAAGFFANTQYSAVPFYSFAYFHRSRMTAGVIRFSMIFWPVHASMLLSPRKAVCFPVTINC